MSYQIEKISLELRRQKSGQEKLKQAKIEREQSSTRYIFEGEKSRAVLYLEEKNQVLSGRLQVVLENEPFRENDNLAFQEPVRIELRLSRQPLRMTAMYLHRDWWTRPAFIESFDEMPERTQSVYMEEEEGVSYLLPLAGECYKTYASPGKEGVLTLTMTAYYGGKSQLDEPVFLLSSGMQIYDAVGNAFSEVTRQRSLPVKKERVYPEMFEYLGWCSWDAFYTDISEKKVREKAKELTEKNVPVRWFLLDDGWLSIHGQRLYDLLPEKQKFPNGFASMIREIKNSSQIDWFGVWHAFGGYWGGIEPGSTAAFEEANHLYESTNGKLLPHPTPEKGYGFFRDWYEKLRTQGIDFVKVDGQSAIKNYYENDIPVCHAAKNTHEALEGAASAYMGGRLINCMGMAMENILGRPGAGLTRNSDDFVPDNDTGFAEHLLQNCYNALYHDALYYCDWDMFWTSHRDAKKHGILRAVSGGPVYISDRIGETNQEAIKPMVYSDGRILRMDRTAKPSPDCIFHDPEKEGLLKVTNICNYGELKKGGAIAVYNISKRQGETRVRSGDIFDLPKGDYFLYNWMEQDGMKLDEIKGETIMLAENGCILFLLLPAGSIYTPIGLLNKYICFHGIEVVAEEKDSQTVVLREGGIFGFFADQKPEKILINARDCTDRVCAEKGIWKIDTKTTGKTVLTMFNSKI